MSIRDQAEIEMRAANFDEDDIQAVLAILYIFFKQWDSGGAVWAMAPVLQKLIAGQPLGPLTGRDDEWVEVGDGVFQNKRMSSVFKDPRFHDGKQAYDIDNPTDPRGAITFPYTPSYQSRVADPAVTLSS